MRILLETYQEAPLMEELSKSVSCAHSHFTGNITQPIDPNEFISESSGTQSLRGAAGKMEMPYGSFYTSFYEEKNPTRIVQDVSPRKRKITPKDKEGFDLKLSKKTLRLPSAFKDLKAEIDVSGYILELKEGWDGENGEPYDIHVWERVVEFLVSMYLNSVHIFDVVPDFPKIYHGPDGTIDLSWEKSDYQILANCPKEEGKQVSFYGEKIKEEIFKGSFYMIDKCPSLLMILVGVKKCRM